MFLYEESFFLYFFVSVPCLLGIELDHYFSINCEFVRF